LTDFSNLNPIVTVIVVTKTGDKAAFLLTLQEQSYDKPYEIILVRGGNRSQARNLAIAQSKSSLVAFIDADCEAGSGWLANLVDGLPDDKNVAGIGGVSSHRNLSSSLETAIDGVFSTYLGSLGSPSLTSLTGPSRYPARALSLHNCIYRKAALLEIGGFDERYELNEDTDISARLREKGYRLIVNRSVFVYHHRRSRLGRFMLQFFWYGVGRSRSMLTSRRCVDGRILSLLLTAVLFALLGSITPHFTFVALVAYSLLVLGSSIAGARQTGRVKLIPKMIVLFLVEHFSYLIGLICGIFLGPWKKPPTYRSMLVSKCYLPRGVMEPTRVDES
jgi:cellulose synthase/poly-beta-1,6-N-acetylglucosamine synthase-like glycosyltransferase